MTDLLCSLEGVDQIDPDEIDMLVADAAADEDDMICVKIFLRSISVPFVSIANRVNLNTNVQKTILGMLEPQIILGRQSVCRSWYEIYLPNIVTKVYAWNRMARHLQNMLATPPQFYDP